MVCFDIPFGFTRKVVYARARASRPAEQGERHFSLSLPAQLVVFGECERELDLARSDRYLMLDGTEKGVGIFFKDIWGR